MSVPYRAIGAVALLVGAVVAGGVVAFDGAGNDPIQQAPAETVTPAPVPVVTATPTPESTPTPVGSPGSAGNNESVGYGSLEPTCERPPGLVVYIQVAALSNNDPETNDGIRTTWRFAAPSNRRFVGPYENFEEVINASYRTLIEAETVTFGSLEKSGVVASQNVTVRTESGETKTYRWRLRRQSDGRFVGCWMTTGVLQVDRSPTE